MILKLNFLIKNNAIILKILKVTAPLLIVVTFLIVLFPFLVLSFYNYFSLDDYYFSVNFINLGFWDGFMDCYTKCNGRYTATSILSFSPLSFGYHNNGAIFVGLGIIFSLILSFLKLIFSFIPKESLLLKMGLASLIIISSIFKLQTPSEAIYWASGAITYTLGFCFFLLFVAFLNEYLSTNNNTKYYLSWFFLFLTIGSNETIMIITDLLIGVVFILISINNKKINSKMLFLAVGAALFSLIVILAPGNTNRTIMETNSLGGNVIHGNIEFTILETYKFLILKFTEWNKQGFLISYFITWVIIGLVLKPSSFSKSKWWFVSPLFYIIILLIATMPVFYNLGIQPPKRTENTLYMFSLLFLAILGINISVFIKQNNWAFIKNVGFLISTIILLYIINLERSNFNVAYSNLNFERLNRMKNELKSRDLQLFEKKSGMTEIPSLSSKPNLLYHGDITEDVNDYSNALFSDYFNISAVKLNPFQKSIQVTKKYNFDSKISSDIEINTTQFDSAVFHSPQFSCKISKDYPYSFSIKKSIGDFGNLVNKIDAVNFKFNVFCEDSTAQFFSVLSISDSPNPTYLLDWQSRDFSYSKLKINQWNEVNCVFDLTNKENFRDKCYFSIYVCHKTGSNIYVDDFDLSFY